MKRTNPTISGLKKSPSPERAKKWSPAKPNPISLKRWLLYQAFIGEGIITIGGYDQVIQDSQIQQFAALNKLAGQVGSATVPEQKA